MKILQIEEQLRETPYMVDTLSEPQDALLGTDYWEIFSRENYSALGRIENGKVNLYPAKNEEGREQKSELIKLLKEKQIPFVD